MSMIDRVFLQRSIRAALSAKEVKAKGKAVQRRRAADRRRDLAQSRRLVAEVKQEREEAARKLRARKNLPAALAGKRPTHRFSRSAPSLTGRVPRLPIARLDAARAVRPGPVVMPSDAQAQQQPDNVWRIVNDEVARQARKDELDAKRRKQRLATEWQRALRTQMEEQRRAREERKAYDARYARMEAHQIADGRRKDAEEQAQLRAKHARERREREEQVQSVRRRRARRLEQEEWERRRNNELFEKQEAKRKAAARDKQREAKQWLKEVAATNQRNMATAHKRMLAQLDEERKLASVWRAQLDAQDKRRQEEFDAIYAASAKTAAFGQAMNIDPDAKAKEDERRAMKWQKLQWEKADREAQRKEQARKRKITEQQQYLDAQVARQDKLRQQAVQAELREQKVLIHNDERAVRKAKQEVVEKRRRNVEYRKELERQRAFDRRRARNEKVPGSMSTVEVLMNRRALKAAIVHSKQSQQHTRGRR